jgi:uncharacterized protein YuzE
MTYDPEADAVYVYLADEIFAGGVKKTYPCDPLDVDGMINLDFDGDGRLIGLEVLGAKGKLPPELLDRLIHD